MRKIALLLGLVCSCSALATPLSDDVKNVFKHYQIENIHKDITFEDGVLKIVTKRQNVHPDAAWSIVIHSICDSVIFNKAIWDKTQFQKVLITNKYQNQGIVFKGSIQECFAIAKMNMDETQQKYNNKTYFEEYP